MARRKQRTEEHSIIEQQKAEVRSRNIVSLLLLSAVLCFFAEKWLASL
jgi:hypothetical protein